MKTLSVLLVLLSAVAIWPAPASGQYKEQGFTIGLEGGGAIGLTEASDHPIRPMGRLDFGFAIVTAAPSSY